jgi:hypothetical protein
MSDIKLICPYCKTPLVSYDKYCYWCECHPLKNYKSLSVRKFSWQYNYKTKSWLYLEAENSGWIEVNEKPQPKQVFIFR